jgi:predicted 3-demethylubiquinone-9 3-methyltransferase (glyoxalase superfamily)
MQKISPFLWFDNQAEEAAAFYVSLFEDAEITDVSRYPEGSPYPAGQVMSVSFKLAGQEFMALNGGPQVTFTHAISFFVRCQDQDEVDRFWAQLLEGGEAQQCGWVTDRFGVTWQIIPDRLGELLGDSDPERAQRAMQAMLQMEKIEIKALEDAANGTDH